jgi:SAM-dependent methyltransferase
LIGPTTGVELSPKAVESAKKAFGHVEFIQVDILSWDYPLEAFDICVSEEVIEHVPDQARYVQIAHDILRPGGYLILTTPNAKSFFAMPKETRENWSRQPIEDWLTIDELRELLKSRFSIVDICTILPGYGSNGIYRAINSVRLRSALKKLHLFAAYNSLRLRMGLGLHTVVLAQRIT